MGLASLFDTRMKTAGGIIVGLATVVATGYVIYDHAHGSTSPPGGEPDDPHYAFTYPPPPDGDGALYPACFTAKVKGAPPSGKSFVYAVQLLADRSHPADERLYFEAHLRSPRTGEWEGNLTLGDRSERKRTFRIFLVLVDTTLAQYLASTNPNGLTWWSSPGNPPGSRTVASVSVHRDGTYDPRC
jgi:hypothetical protein